MTSQQGVRVQSTLISVCSSNLSSFGDGYFVRVLSKSRNTLAGSTLFIDENDNRNSLLTTKASLGNQMT